MLGTLLLDRSQLPRVDGSDGWVTRSLHYSLKRALLRGHVLWQLIMIGAVLTSSDIEQQRLLLVLVQIVVIIAMVLGELERIPIWFVGVVLYATLIVNWSMTRSIDGVLCFATVWMGNLGHLFPSLLLRRRLSLFFGAISSFGMGLVVWLHEPAWWNLSISIAVTGVAMYFAGRMGLRFLMAYAVTADDQAAVSQQEHEAVLRAQIAQAESAEQARVLHDTVVNTLAAVASGGRAVHDTALVQERCRRDVMALEALLDGTKTRNDVTRLADVIAELGLTYHLIGLDKSAIVELTQQLPREVMSAVRGATRELLLNVSKHSQVTDVEVGVEHVNGMFEITVQDRGVGFNPEHVVMSGLAESVIARVEAVGVTASIESSPGMGTKAVLSYPTSRPPVTISPVADSSIDSATEVLDSACWLWAAGVVVVGIIIELSNRSGALSVTYVALAVIVAMSAFARRLTKHREYLSPVVASVVVATVPIVYLLALWDIDFGHQDVTYWQTSAVTPLLVIVLLKTRGQKAFFVGMAALIVTGLIAAITVGSRESLEVGAIIVLGTLSTAAVMLGWTVFARSVRRIGQQGEQERQAAMQSRHLRAQIDAARSARERWGEVGLHRCLTFLRDLSNGSRHPTDLATQREASEEEAYLRQLLLMDAQLANSGLWFARALAQARDMGVHLQVRTGSHDIDDATTAQAFGELLAAVVAGAPRHVDVTVTLHATDVGLRFGLVAPTPIILDATTEWRPPANWRITTATYGDVDLFEALLSTPIQSDIERGESNMVSENTVTR